MSYLAYPDYVEGLLVKVVSVDRASINPGACRDSANQYDIRVPAQLDAVLAASGANGLDVGVEAANTWYAVHVIDGPTVSPASLLSLSDTAPTLPAGYTVFRRVGWVRNDGASQLLIAQQVQSGLNRQTFYDDSQANLTVLSNGAAAANTNVDCSALVPPTTLIAQFAAVQKNSGGPTLTIRGVAVDGNLAEPIFTLPSAEANCGLPIEYFSLDLRDDTSIQYLNSAAGGASDIYLVSYTDQLGLA